MVGPLVFQSVGGSSVVRSSEHTPGAICFILLWTIRVGWLVFHFILLHNDVKYLLVIKVGCACFSALPSFPLSLLRGETLFFQLWLISPQASAHSCLCTSCMVHPWGDAHGLGGGPQGTQESTDSQSAFCRKTEESVGKKEDAV